MDLDASAREERRRKRKFLEEKSRVVPREEKRMTHGLLEEKIARRDDSEQNELTVLMARIRYVRAFLNVEKLAKRLSASIFSSMLTFLQLSLYITRESSLWSLSMFTFKPPECVRSSSNQTSLVKFYLDCF